MGTEICLRWHGVHGLLVAMDTPELQLRSTGLADHLFLNALVTAAAGLDSASKLVCFCPNVDVAR